MVDVKTANVLFLKKDYDRALKMYYEGATNGDAECAFNYAYCHLMGIGTEIDEKVAKTFFTYAQLIIPEANYNLAVMYLHGVGVRRDCKKAYEYMYEAGRRDVIEAQLYLGVAHTMGMLFEPEVIAISRIPYHKPITRENYYLLEGEVPNLEADEDERIGAIRFDPVSAREWFKMASQHSPDYVEEYLKQGKYLYARCFVDGLGTDFNREKANALMIDAAREGSEEAVAYIELNAPYLLPELKKKLELNEGR